MTKKKIGLMGGTFDPIHYGHLVAAEEARINFNLSKVIFIPAGNPPHKKDYPVTDAEHRYIMTALAVNSNPFFEVSRVEIDREGYTYTVDTLKWFKEKYKDAVEIFFISGADAILDILTWKKVEEVMNYCTFIAATRPGYTSEQLERKVKEVKEIYGKEIFVLEVTGMAISSTEIRKKVKNGQSIKYLVPEAVEYYILKYNLYR
ncbi:putative nicotinate-nucleotide adenylyltransferase [Thermovenabulum gondwanense]|uniref:Probable nicotinate-nucleotide adenylyltransferase n=1 Tax=Thermovenabulum gondwanense TaxID=520767 RepID=A0A161PTC2_9FIRM|nr:nicotinate-nucleotide adenylyltransferase [Thermovenabulum gondwanense]KYO64753.1 putative nicotinate-nucleotide adenylyltransferase [Thermovenabulum gondwanense]